jgi:hypothetical protein
LAQIDLKRLVRDGSVLESPPFPASAIRERSVRPRSHSGVAPVSLWKAQAVAVSSAKAHSPLVIVKGFL